MTAVKMPLINVGLQVSADVCKGDGSGLMWTATGTWGSKMALLRTLFMDEPLSRI